jgi:hypothetical protein
VGKKIFFRAFLAVTLLVVVALSTKDYLIQRLLTSYVKATFRGECRISGTDVSFGKISIYNFSFSNPACKVLIKRAIVTFAVSPESLLKLSSVSLEEGKLTVIDLKPSSPRAKNPTLPASLSDVAFYLKDMALEFPDINNARVTAEISLALRIKKGGDFSVGDMTITHFKADSDGFTVEASALRGLASARVGTNMLRDIKVDLSNSAGGLIHVKDESSLDFLRKYMDDRSFKALVDNFKNYAYNIGTVAVRREGRDVIVEADFDSPVMGHRKIVVKFHDCIEGGG